MIGAGTMGNGIAHVFAQHGFEVNLVDVSAAQLEKALQTIAKNFDRQIAKGTIREDIKKQSLANISTFSVIKEGVQDADIVVEAATENVDLKLKIFKEIDEAAQASAILSLQHFIHINHKNRCSYKTRRKSYRYAFYESCAGNETGGSY